MSKKKNTNSSNEKNTDQNVVTIDLQSLLIPMAIVIAGVMVSVTLFFALREDTGTVQGTTTETTVPTGDSAAVFPDVTTNIDDDPQQGNPDAKVAIVEFSDYECPFCQRHFEQTYPSLKSNYIDNDQVLFVYRDNPLDFHPQGRVAALAANCVADQLGDDGYFAYHDALFTNGVESTTPDSLFVELAQAQGVNVDQFNTCRASAEVAQEVDADIADAMSIGSTGTPGFVIGTLDDEGNVTGQLISGAYPYSDFETLIEKYLNQ